MNLTRTQLELLQLMQNGWILQKTPDKFIVYIREKNKTHVKRPRPKTVNRLIVKGLIKQKFFSPNTYKLTKKGKAVGYDVFKVNG